MRKRSLVFTTNNPHKFEEVSQILGNTFRLLTLGDIGFSDDIPETADTLEGNALIKAEYIHQRFGLDVFADDTGLEIAALNGRPGVYSARYAGESKAPQANMLKVLRELEGHADRSARFRTVVALILNGERHFFEGIINGHITEEKRGEAGFGYDPIFVPEGYDLTFAQLGNEEKNKISHRAIAVERLKEFLMK